MAVDIKLLFVTVSLITWLYSFEVQSYSDEYSVKACKSFRISGKELYYFVTYPEMVDKWLDWVTFFTSADQKNIGIGKMYKAVIRNCALFFRITDFEDGHFIALESNFLFRPKVELWFSEEGDDCATHSAILHVRLFFLRSSALFQYTVGPIFRAIFEYQLRESLNNLRLMLQEVESCPYTMHAPETRAM